MHHPLTLRLAVPLLLIALTACQSETGTETNAPVDGASDGATQAGDAAPENTGSPQSSETSQSAANADAANLNGAGEPIEHTLVPLPGNEGDVPVLTRAATVVLDTTAGDVTIEVYPEAAPNAAQRFIELVESGFYDDTPISRVVPGFVAQFGVNWREPHSAWRERPFNDDPTLFALERGTLAFAKAGPNTNTTQVFINYAENNRLAAPDYNFTVFAKVVDGMDVVDSFVQVGDPSGGLDQARLWSDGGAYLESLEVKPTMIERAVVQEPAQ